MKIGILQTGHVVGELLENHGDFDGMFRKLLDGYGFEFETYNVVDNEFPNAPTQADGWLITGSAHGAYEDLPWIAKLEDFLRQTYAKDVPIVGICFGHQILAKAMGGEVVKYDQGWSIGNQAYALAAPLDEKVRVVAWHQDQVTKLPEHAECLGSSPFCQNAFVRYGNTAFTMQAHPEFDTAFGKDLMEYRKDSLPQPLIEEARAHFDEGLDQEKMAAQITSFFKERTLKAG
ncbi:type 1 glutamine amidotransferase [uncultured Maritalea sp.]|uniref:type 1 glutamine amidotransferase n=1 Tax=uncultured Maritalea sp. TaxID=757249 RepID=UPI00261CBC8F|nr:type 1 glutamine amidotransferase [uncultured Maritalea sp.]